MASRASLSLGSGSFALMPRIVFGAMEGQHLTTGGYTCQPPVVGLHNHNRLVVNKSKFTPKRILRDNVRALLASKIGPTSQSALGRKPGTGGQPTIGRIVSDEGENPKLETIAAIAAAYELEAWQILVAGMDPKNPPVLQPVTKEQKEFWARLQKLYEEVRQGPPGQ